jgi:hypothetical protein
MKKIFSVLVIALLMLSMVIFAPSASASVTKNLHVSGGYDATDSHTLTSADLTKLYSSDNNRYKSTSTWSYTFEDTEYISFEFEDITIPSGATIDSVVLKFEWQRYYEIDNARLRIYVDASLITTISLTPLPSSGFDRIETINLLGVGIDTEAEINDLVVKFQATDGWCAYTEHDWVQVDVTYTPKYSVTFYAVASPGLPDVADSTVILSVTIGATSYDITNAQLPATFTNIDSGTTISYSYNSPIDRLTTGARYRWDSTTGTGSASGQTGQSGSFVLTSDSTLTATYETQYYLTVISAYDTPGGDGWYDDGDTAYATLVYGTEPLGPGVQAVFTGWSGDATGTGLTSDPITMDGPKTAIAQWQIQYYLDVVTDPSSLVPIPGANWYDECTWVELTAPEYVSIASDIRYRFDYWDVDGTPVPGNPIDIHMDEPHTATAHYMLQFLVTFKQNGLDGSAVGTVVTVDGDPKIKTQLPFSKWVDNGDVVVYAYESIVADGVGKRFYLYSVTGPTSPITVTAPITVTGTYKKQWQITVTASPSGAIGGTFKVNYTQFGVKYTNEEHTTEWIEWVDHNTWVNVSDPQAIISGSPGTQYVFDHYNPDYAVKMTDKNTITLCYKTQYLVSFTQTGSGVPPTVEYSINSGPTATDTVPFDVWVDSDSTIAYTYQGIVYNGAGIRYVLINVNPTSPQTVNSPLTITGYYKTQYYLTVNIYPSGLTPLPTPSSGWYDECTDVYLYAYPRADGNTYMFIRWKIDSTIIFRKSTTVHMDAPKTATAYYCKVPPDPLGDVNIDGTVNMIDIQLIAKHYGTKTGDPNFNAGCDVNFDGEINIADLVIAARHFGE